MDEDPMSRVRSLLDDILCQRLTKALALPTVASLSPRPSWTLQQATLRDSLLVRDGCCIVTGVHWETCEPALIVPLGEKDVSRPRIV